MADDDALDPSDDGAAPTTKRRRRYKRIGGIRILPSGKAQVRVRGEALGGVPFALEQTVAPHLAELTLAKFRAQAELYRAGTQMPEQYITLAEWRVRFLAKRNISKKDKRWTSEQGSSWKFLRRLHRLPLQAINAEAVNSWATAALWSGEGRAPRGSGKGSLSYIRHCFELLNRLIAAAVDAQVISRCPWGMSQPSQIPTYSETRNKREPITPEDLSKLLRGARASKEESFYLRVWSQLQTGQRPHELARAEVSWLVPVESVPYATQVVGAALLKMPEAKKGNKHLVPIPPDLHAALRAHIAALPPSARATGFIFPVLYRKRWRMRASFIPASTWRALCRRVGVADNVVSYQTRHTRLTDVREGVAGPAAQAIAGHKREQTTAQSYYGTPEIHRHGAKMYETTETMRMALQLTPPDDEPTPPPRGGRRSRSKKARTVARILAKGAHVKARAQNAAKALLDFQQTHERALGHAVQSVASQLGAVPSSSHALTMPSEENPSLVKQLQLASVVIREVPPTDLQGVRAILAKMREESGEPPRKSRSRAALEVVAPTTPKSLPCPQGAEMAKNAVTSRPSPSTEHCFTRNGAVSGERSEASDNTGEKQCKG